MPRIAVVDTDAELIGLMGEIFAWEGWQVLAVTERDVVGVVCREMPDLILLEPWLQCPDAGWKVLEQLRSLECTRGIPAVVWTSNANRLQSRAPWLAEQGIPVLAKPFEIDEVLGLVRGLLVS